MVFSYCSNPPQTYYSTIFFIQYSVLCKKENAHDENIWTCAWGRYTPEKKKKEEEPEGEGGDDEKSRYTCFVYLFC